MGCREGRAPVTERPAAWLFTAQSRALACDANRQRLELKDRGRTLGRTSVALQTRRR